MFIQNHNSSLQKRPLPVKCAAQKRHCLKLPITSCSEKMQRPYHRMYREMWIPESGKCLLVEFGIRKILRFESGSWSLESGIQVRMTKTPKYSTWNPESTARNPD